MATIIAVTPAGIPPADELAAIEAAGAEAAGLGAGDGADEPPPLPPQAAKASAARTAAAGRTNEELVMALDREKVDRRSCITMPNGESCR
ncbi:MAG: hypothetical protein ABI442_17860 [Gemmatimonadaceae bacterium]